MTTLASDAWSIDAERLGVHRSLEPRGALPHIAVRLDVGPPNRYEAELSVQTLAIDATSFAAIREHSHRDPLRMAETISQIVSERGKLQNPWTGSGGVVMGRVTEVGPDHVNADLVAGELVVPLASLIAIPMTLDRVGPVDPANPQVPVSGRAIVTGSMLCVRVPADLPPAVALAALDVYPAASHTRALTELGGDVLILGAGHAGLLALAAAREAGGPDATLAVVDRSAPALDKARRIDPAVIILQADVTDPLAVAQGLAERGAARADLTLLCTSVAGAEGAALLATAPRGTIVFFSTATRFAAAALGADAIGTQPRLLIPHGLTDDRGDYTFELLRSIAPLQEAFA